MHFVNVGNARTNICEDVNGFHDQEESLHLETDGSRKVPAKNSNMGNPIQKVLPEHRI